MLFNVKCSICMLFHLYIKFHIPLFLQGFVYGVAFVSRLVVFLIQDSLSSFPIRSMA